MKIKNCLWSLIAICSVFTISSCSDEPDSVQPMDDLRTEIYPDGTASSGAVFSRIDENTFWLNYVKYKIVDSHLEIVGYDPVELPTEPKLFAEVKIDGAVLKTRKVISKRDYSGYYVKIIGAFENAKCEKITIPKTVSYIDEYCFKNCISLSSTTLPEGLTTIDEGCFYGCTSLSSITLPAGLTTIGTECFYGCTSLSSITLPKSITSIKGGCFSGCTSLSSITLPESITTIGYFCFSDCTSLSSITLPEGLSAIPAGCFKGCSSLSSITLPKSLTKFVNFDFYGCTSLKNFIFQSTNPPSFTYYMIVDYNDWYEFFKPGFGDWIDDYIFHVNNVFHFITAYVPRESLELYKQEFEGDFKEILPIE